MAEKREMRYGWNTRKQAAEIIQRIQPEDLGTLYSALGMAKGWAEQNIMLGSTISNQPETGFKAHIERFTELGERLNP